MGSQTERGAAWAPLIEAIVQIFATYLKEHHAERGAVSINDAFQQRFHVPLPDELNDAHKLVIVAGRLDPSTERIVRYLATEYGVRTNALFLRVFKDEEREYLARAWLREQTAAEAKPPKGPALEWNGEYYVSFGGDANRSWEEAAKAVKEKGFFGNQNTVARPTTAAWGYTVDRLKQRWGID